MKDMDERLLYVDLDYEHEMQEIQEKSERESAKDADAVVPPKSVGTSMKDMDESLLYVELDYERTMREKSERESAREADDQSAVAP
jgi:hypothetical protein